MRTGLPRCCEINNFVVCSLSKWLLGSYPPVLAILRARTPYLCHILAYWRICTFLLLIIDMWMQPMDKNKSWLFSISAEQSSRIGLNLCMYELKVKIEVNSSPWDVNSHWVTSIVRICRDTSFAEVNDTSEQSCKVAQLPCATRFPPGCRLCRRQMPNCEGRVPFQYQNDYLDLFVLILFGVDEYFSGFNCHISKKWDGNAIKAGKAMYVFEE